MRNHWPVRLQAINKTIIEFESGAFNHFMPDKRIIRCFFKILLMI